MEGFTVFSGMATSLLASSSLKKYRPGVRKRMSSMKEGPWVEHTYTDLMKFFTVGGLITLSWIYFSSSRK